MRATRDYSPFLPNAMPKCPLTATQRPLTIGALGTSLTWGADLPPLERPWPQRLQALLRSRLGRDDIFLVNGAMRASSADFAALCFVRASLPEIVVSRVILLTLIHTSAGRNVGSQLGRRTRSGEGSSTRVRRFILFICSGPNLKFHAYLVRCAVCMRALRSRVDDAAWRSSSTTGRAQPRRSVRSSRHCMREAYPSSLSCTTILSTVRSAIVLPWLYCGGEDVAVWLWRRAYCGSSKPSSLCHRLSSLCHRLSNLFH